MTSAQAFPATRDVSELLGPEYPPDRRATAQLTVRAIMAMTLNGSAALDGTSGKLGNATDSALLLGVRGWADIVLVGASTVVAEDYGGTPATPQRPQPAPIAVLSKSLKLSPQARLFSNTHAQPFIACPHETLMNEDLAHRRQRLREAGARFIDCGDGSPTAILQALAAQGFEKISCEGGPNVLGPMVAAGLIDQFYLTLDPHLGAAAETPLTSHATPTWSRFELEHVAPVADGTVFLRYRRALSP
ncbi:pyrimidine reductase family protein [Corynebacterium lizhenjunii]|uniref:Pyrimidine reductase family protein n=1 Tax=Corynebacterium lizhenjunii TaxID=2709394 RepID=A0A7T0PB97_9CORY|nr:pyrimidine reductase family protein [Corynebacterium lizhenjunii]QPK78317.1 pyrimidine reductase family protein [Corynebacterium lizhenjunii]